MFREMRVYGELQYGFNVHLYTNLHIENHLNFYSGVRNCKVDREKPVSFPEMTVFCNYFNNWNISNTLK